MTSLATLVQTAQRALTAVMASFSPPANASSRTIRVNGAICLGIGALCVVVSGALALWLRAPPQLLLLPALLAYAFFTVGGYRVIRGKEPQAGEPGEVSVPRILLGCVSAIFCFVLLIGMAFLVSLLFEP